MPTTMWGVHNNQPKLDLVDNGFVSIGWAEMGDLRASRDDRDAMKQRVAAAYPDIKPNAIPGTAGTLLSFAYAMQVGDLVVYPHKPDSTVNVGRITGDYRFDADASLHRNRRDVQWLATGIPRTDFSVNARREIGSAITVFRVRRHTDEFEQAASGTPPTPQPTPTEQDPEAAVEAASLALSAERIETETTDFVISTLMSKLEGVEFEHFVAHLLEAMGYRTRVTQASGDGGVDIIAHHDALALQPPIIKVQCKRTTRGMGGPDVQQLTGTLAPGGNELGLFVTLGSFSKDAVHIERSRQDIRLINGTDLVGLVFAHYEKFSPDYKRLLPMRSVYVVDNSIDAG